MVEFGSIRNSTNVGGGHPTTLAGLGGGGMEGIGENSRFGNNAIAAGGSINL